MPTTKRCGGCAHSMENDMGGAPDVVYCIHGPATPVAVNGQVVSFFPLMKKWGKCDGFEPGKTQKQNKQAG